MSRSRDLWVAIVISESSYYCIFTRPEFFEVGEAGGRSQKAPKINSSFFLRLPPAHSVDDSYKYPPARVLRESYVRYRYPERCVYRPTIAARNVHVLGVTPQNVHVLRVTNRLSLQQSLFARRTAACVAILERTDHDLDHLDPNQPF